MKNVFKGLILLLFLLITTVSWGQNKTVTGKVTGENGAPITGASVMVKNTKVGTTTNENGEFSISVSPTVKTLTITSVGFEMKDVIITETPLAVSLLKIESKLDEVVVVGYGTQKKSVTTGAITSVKAKDLEKVPNGRVEQALQGRVSGVTIMQNSGQPGSVSKILIRGVTTFGDGNNNPLWVVDGVVVDQGGIGYLNQSDIESIEVLKDAASAAIYGTRAATGVILVTTKKGKAGKMNVSYNGFYGTSAPAKVLNLLNATQYAVLMNERRTNDGNSIMFDDVNSLGLGTDWQKAIFNYDARRYSHEISLSGGNDRSTFYLSFGTSNQNGIVATDISNYDRKSIRLNSMHKISSIFTVGQTVGYTHAKSIGLGNTNSEYGGPLSSAINLDPLTPLVVTDPVASAGEPYRSNPVIKDANGNPYGISQLVGVEMTNPLAYMKTRQGQYDWSDDIVGNAYLEAAITKDIKIKSSLGSKLAYWGYKGYTPVYYLSATNNTVQNNYGQVNNRAFAWNVENTITYSKKILDHSFTILLGQGAYSENNGGVTSATIYNLPIEDYKDASFNFDIPQADRRSGAGDFIAHQLSSIFARLNYNFSEKYLFTGIIRRDGSSRFGKNHKYGTYPSFSAGWVVNKENFWVTNRVVNSLKIRGGYGQVGNDAIGDFKYLSLVKGGFNYTLGNGDNITTGYAPITLDNPDLHWETTTQSNVGFEAQLFNGLSLNVDLYKKKTSGILRPIPIPGYVGVSERPAGNVADMQNTGLEIEVGYRKKFGELNFSANGNIGFLKNEVTYVNSDADFITGDASFQSMSAVTRTQVGQSYNAFYGYKTDGIFQNWADVNAYANKDGGLIQPNARPGDFRWTDVNGDGTITSADKTFLGTSLPKYTYGLTLNFNYRDFDLMIFGQGAGGNKIFQGLRRLDILSSNFSTKALSRWTGEGSSNTFPRLTATDANGNYSNMSDFYLEKGDYLRLKVVQLGYNLPSSLVNKIRAARLRVYITAENLLTLTNYTGYDPEIGGGVYGIDKGVYPQARCFMAGVQLQF